MTPSTLDDHRCDACERGGRTRRQFLETAGYLAGMIALLGLSPRDARALPILRTRGESSGAQEKRYPIPAADSVNVDHEEQVIVVRAQGHVYVFNLACPHQQAAVKWLPNDNRFQCTKHDSKYTPEGVYMSGRATRNLDRFVIRKDGNSIVVDLDHVIQSDKDPSAWAAATFAV